MESQTEYMGDYDAEAAFRGWTPRPIEPSGDVLRMMDGKQVKGRTNEGAMASRYYAETQRQLEYREPSDAQRVLGTIAINQGEKNDWREKANCKGLDPDLFFPKSSHAENRDAVKAICDECVVKVECREYGIAHEKFGAWGGLTEREIRRIRRGRARAARATL